jgi:GTP-binding protein
MPQTRFVTKKALALGLKPIVVVNKIDRDGARPDWVIDHTFDLFDKLGATDEQLDFPVLYASAINGYATRDLSQPPRDMRPMFETILESVSPPHADEIDSPLQMQISALDYSSYVGRIGIGRIQRGRLKPAQQVLLMFGPANADGKYEHGTPKNAKVGQIFGFRGMERVALDEALAGDIVLITGIDDLSIGCTITDIEQPEALPMLHIDEPTLNMTFLVNNSPYAGSEGKFVTSRQIGERLRKELLTNMALRVEETSETDSFLVSDHFARNDAPRRLRTRRRQATRDLQGNRRRNLRTV